MVLPLTDQTVSKPLAKIHPVCSKCKKRLDGRVPRGRLVKMFLFWLPLKRYKCIACNRKLYILGK